MPTACEYFPLNKGHLENAVKRQMSQYAMFHFKSLLYILRLIIAYKTDFTYKKNLKLFVKLCLHSSYSFHFDNIFFTGNANV